MPPDEPTVEGEQLSLDDRVAELERQVRALNSDDGGGGAAATSLFLAQAVVERVGAASETRGSTSFGDLATAGPVVTVKVGPSGVLLVGISASLKFGAAAADLGAYMSFDLDGPDGSVYSADNQRCVMNSLNHWMAKGATFMFTSLALGDHTITAKYASAVSGTNAAFVYRELWGYSPTYEQPQEEAPA